MDLKNPAVAQLTNIPPAVLAEISANPASFGPWVRALLAVHLDKMHDLINQDPDYASPGQRMDFMKFLASIGDAMPKVQVAQQAAGSGFSVQINIGTPDKSAKPASPVVIENGHDE